LNWTFSFGKKTKLTNAYSDAFGFFGASGDLAYKQIFPADGNIKVTMLHQSPNRDGMSNSCANVLATA
jgi:hypothetical protein